MTIWQGLAPEVVPSTFSEDLSHNDYADDPTQYAVATATEKVHFLLPLM